MEVAPNTQDVYQFAFTLYVTESDGRHIVDNRGECELQLFLFITLVIEKSNQ